MTNLKKLDKSNRKSNSKSQDQENAKRTKSLRHKALFAVLVCLLLAFFWTGGIVGFANSMAQNAIASQRLDSADWWLNVSRSISSSNALSDFLQARTERKRGNLDKMSNHLKVAFKKGFDPRRLDREQDLAAASLGRLTKEVEDRLNLWLEGPNAEVGEIIDSYANGLTAVSRFDNAMELLKVWEENAPWEPVANYRIARINEHLSRATEAEAQYKKAIEKDRKYQKATYNLARVLLDQKRPEEALKFFQSCNSGASALAAKTGMARCYKTLGETEKARTLLHEVLKSSYQDLLDSYRCMDEIPERFVAASELGILETELGDFAVARKYLEIALKVHPLDSIARYSYAVALRGLRLQKEAEENFAITRTARASLDQVTVLQEVLRKDLQDTQSRIMIGKIVLEHESERTGLFWLQSVFSYDPTNSEAHEAIANFFESKKNMTPEDKKRAAYHRSFVTKK